MADYIPKMMSFSFADNLAVVVLAGPIRIRFTERYIDKFECCLQVLDPLGFYNILAV